MATFDPRFEAAGSTTARGSFIVPDSALLSAKGIVLDIVQSVQNEVGQGSDMHAVLHKFHAWRAALCKEFGYGLKLHQSFCRAICLGQIEDEWDLTLLLHFLYHTMDSLLGLYLPNLPLDPRLDCYKESPPSVDLTELEVYQRFFRLGLITGRLVVTSNSLVCLGPGLAEPGDLVAVLIGCNIPVLLRELESGSFSFVSEIYVDDYMYGRAIEEVNYKTRNIQTLTIV